MKQIILLLLLILPYLSPAQSLDWQIPDVQFSTSDTVQAQFYCFGFDSITAYQMAMKFDTGALKFIGVSFPDGNPMQISLGCFSWPGKPGYNVKPGELRHGRSMPYGSTFPDGTHGFSYVFVAKQSGALSQKLTLSTCCLNPPMNPMSYRWPLIYQPLTVAYVAPEISATDAPALYLGVRIYPNPTSDVITIECDAPAQVEIYNTLGILTYRGSATQDQYFSLSPGANLIRVTDGKNVVLKTVFRL